jgi:hypothetical protein
MTFLDLVADARDIEDVIDLVNEVLVGLQSTRELKRIPKSVQPPRITAVSDIPYSLNLVAEEIKRRDVARDAISEVTFALHAVLETAVERMRTSYHWESRKSLTYVRAIAQSRPGFITGRSTRQVLSYSATRVRSGQFDVVCSR